MYVGLNCLKNLCLSLVSGVPTSFLGLHPWRIVAKPVMRCVHVSKTRIEQFSGRGENCQRNVTDLAGSLVTSFRPPGRLQKRPDDRTTNAGVAVRTADGSRRTADAGDEQCLWCGCSSPSCPYCGTLCCRHRWTAAHAAAVL